MNRRERLMASLRGEAVDRPPVCFYELNGLDEDAEDSDPFNIFNDPSWGPLIDLTRERSDRIVMRGAAFRDVVPDPVEEIAHTETFDRNGSRITVRTVRIGSRELVARSRRDPDVNTVWVEKHLLEDADDVYAYLSLPEPELSGEPDIAAILQAEQELGDAGIVLIDTPDPLCLAALLFDMSDYLIVALTEPALFHRLLERFAAALHARTEAVARALPGRLWRIYGPEYASPPYLSPGHFRDYVVQYDKPMVEAIQRHGGFARIHCHGRLAAILDDIASTGCTGLDPIEPPPQGDVQLRDVRSRHGRQMTLFGNIELSDIEGLPTDRFAEKVKRALEEGTAGEGRGFVLMPSACPIGRNLSPRTVANYELMVEMAGRF